MRNFLLAVSVILLVPFKPSVAQPGELIRKKLENTQHKNLSAFGELLNCAEALYQFYEGRSFETVWNPRNTAQLITAIQDAELEGLNPADYHIKKLEEIEAYPPVTERDIADHDLLLTDAFLLYVSHLLSGKVNPQTINAECYVSQRSGDPVELLQHAISSDSIISTIHSAMPLHDGYKNLKEALQFFLNIQSHEWPVIEYGSAIEPGMTDDRLPVITKRLVILGDLKKENETTNTVYNDSLQSAAKRFQKRHGLTADGVIGQETLKELNLSIESRINQIRANMERWRWQPNAFGKYHITVNIAGFELDVIRDGKTLRTHKVVVGRPYRRTPAFTSKLEYLVFNPTWTIPPTILNEDVLPVVRKDPKYLDRKNIIVFDNNGNSLNTEEINWKDKGVRKYTYRQLPGPDNALGVVKFMFHNSFSIYLHDTPSKELFNQTERTFSSGCIRVEEALDLAGFLLNDSSNWSREKIDKIVASRITQTVQLEEQPDIFILYWTAWADAYNTVNFRKDVYDRDEPLLKQLNKKPDAQPKYK